MASTGDDDAAPVAGEAASDGLVRSTLIVGGATFGTIIINLVRTKIFALLLGPAGIGLLTTLTALLTTAGWIASLGTGTSGVRELAAAKDEYAARRARFGLWTLTWLLAVAGAAGLWLLRAPLSEEVLASLVPPATVGWIGLGVAATVLVGTQQAVLQGSRRVGDLARARLWGALAGAVAGVGLVWSLGARGVVPALVAAPVLAAVTALFFRNPAGSVAPPPAAPWAEWRALIALGATVTVAAAASGAAQLLVRSAVLHRFGDEAAGLFGAVWSISATNLGLLLSAMAADYLPRMSATGADHRAARALFNDQLRIALALGAPVLLLISAGAPLALHLLYTEAFTPAAQLLRWQAAADALKLATVGLTMLLLARGDTTRYLLSDLLIHACFASLAWALLPYLGLEAAGVAGFLSYAIGLLVLLLMAGRSHRVGPSRANAAEFSALLLSMLALITVAGQAGASAAAGAGALLTAVFAWRGLRALGRMDPRLVPAPLRRFAAR